MLSLEWTFALQYAVDIVLLLLMLILLHRINRVKTQMDTILKEVKRYVEYITEENVDTINNIEEKDIIGKETRKKSEKYMTKKQKEEAQNHLIQSVLKEYFP